MLRYIPPGPRTRPAMTDMPQVLQMTRAVRACSVVLVWQMNCSQVYTLINAGRACRTWRGGWFCLGLHPIGRRSQGNGPYIAPPVQLSCWHAGFASLQTASVAARTSPEAVSVVAMRRFGDEQFGRQSVELAVRSSSSKENKLSAIVGAPVCTN